MGKASKFNARQKQSQSLSVYSLGRCPVCRRAEIKLVGGKCQPHYQPAPATLTNPPAPLEPCSYRGPAVRSQRPPIQDHAVPAAVGGSYGE